MVCLLLQDHFDKNEAYEKIDVQAFITVKKSEICPGSGKCTDYSIQSDMKDPNK